MVELVSNIVSLPLFIHFILLASITLKTPHFCLVYYESWEGMEGSKRQDLFCIYCIILSFFFTINLTLFYYTFIYIPFTLTWLVIST